MAGAGWRSAYRVTTVPRHCPSAQALATRCAYYTCGHR